MSIEALAAEYEKITAEEGEPVIDSVANDQVVSDDHVDEVASEDNSAASEGEATTENPPGYIDNLDDWIAAGKDPDKFRGKEAYKDEYKRIQENREMQDRLKAMENTLKSTVDAVADRERIKEEQHKKELEDVLARAREDGDTDAAIDAVEQLNDLKSTPAPQAPKEHPVISDFVSSNSILDNPDIKDEFARIYNGRLRADGVSPTDVLNDDAVKGYLRSTMDSVKNLYPDRFKSPKIGRQTPPNIKPKPAAAKVDIEQALKNYKVEGAAGQNADAAYGIYQSIKATNPEGAEAFAKTILGIK